MMTFRDSNAHQFGDTVEKGLDNSELIDGMRDAANKHREQITNAPGYVDRRKLFTDALAEHNPFTHNTTNDITGCFVDSL